MSAAATSHTSRRAGSVPPHENDDCGWTEKAIEVWAKLTDPSRFAFHGVPQVYAGTADPR